MCDGNIDCADGSDEENCKAIDITVQCSTYDEFKCADGKKCIKKSERCDQNYDCADKSDELDCDHYSKEFIFIKIERLFKIYFYY